MFIYGHWPFLAVYSWNTICTDFTEFFVVCASEFFSAKYVQLLSWLLHCSVQGSKILFTLFQRFVFLACTLADIINVTGWVSFHCYVCEYTFSSGDYTCGNWQIKNHSVCKNSIVFAMSLCFIFVWFFFTLFSKSLFQSWLQFFKYPGYFHIYFQNTCCGVIMSLRGLTVMLLIPNTI